MLALLLYALPGCAKSEKKYDVASLIFKAGSYNSGYTTIVIDESTKTAQNAYIQSPTLGPEKILTDKEAVEWVKKYDGAKIKKSKISNEDFDNLQSSLTAYGIKHWKSDYPNKDVMDGQSWELKITYKDGSSSYSKGYSKYPQNWLKLYDTIYKIAPSE